MLSRVCVVFGLAALLAGVADVLAQDPKVQGGVKGGQVRGPKPWAPDPSYARVMPAHTFAALTVETRRKVIGAWLLAPQGGGPLLIDMLEAGLRDQDSEVRLRTTTVLRELAGRALRARRTGSRPVLDPTLHARLRATVLQSLEHDDHSFRSEIASVMLVWAAPPDSGFERALLDRLSDESHPLVRSRIVTVLASAAAGGSDAAQHAVLNGLKEPYAEVQLAALNGIRRQPTSAALPTVVQLIRAPEDWLRLAAVRTIAAFGNAARAHAGALEDHLRVEPSVVVAAELRRLLDSLGQK